MKAKEVLGFWGWKRRSRMQWKRCWSLSSSGWRRLEIMLQFFVVIFSNNGVKNKSIELRLTWASTRVFAGSLGLDSNAIFLFEDTRDCLHLPFQFPLGFDWPPNYHSDSRPIHLLVAFNPLSGQITSWAIFNGELKEGFGYSWRLRCSRWQWRGSNAKLSISTWRKRD